MKYIVSKKIVIVEDKFWNSLLYDLDWNWNVFEIDPEIKKNLVLFQKPTNLTKNDIELELLSNKRIVPFYWKDNFIDVFDTKKIIRYSRQKQKRNVSKAVVYLTNACNLNCIHCGLNSWEKLLTEMSDMTVKKLVDQIYSNWFEVLQFSWWEPFLRKDLLLKLLLNNCKRFDIIWINTNAILLTEQDINTLKKIKNLVIYTSIYWYDATSYIKNTNRDNFKKAEENIKLLVENWIDVRASICLHKNTLDNLDNYKSYAESLWISKIAYIGIIPTWRAAFRYRQLVWPRKEYIKKLNYIPTILDESFINNEIIDHPRHLVKKRIVVYANWEVVPSEFFPITFGNIQNHSLSDLLWTRVAMYYLNNFNVDDVDFCKDCAFRYICKSICPSFIYAATWSLKNPPLTCELALKYYYKNDDFNISIIGDE